MNHLFMADIAQLVRATDCGSVGRGFETRCSPILFKQPTHFVFLQSDCDFIIFMLKNMR